MQYTEPRPQPEAYPFPKEGQNVKPEGADIESCPIEFESDQELDLDKEKTKISPKTNPPELY